MCKCKVQHCNNGHYPIQVSGDGDVDWVGCPECVIDGVHLCDNN